MPATIIDKIVETNTHYTMDMSVPLFTEKSGYEHRDMQHLIFAEYKRGLKAIVLTELARGQGCLVSLTPPPPLISRWRRYAVCE